jgi:hypothetical protein
MIIEAWQALDNGIMGGGATSYLYCEQLMSSNYIKLDYEAVGFVNMKR